MPVLPLSLKILTVMQKKESNINTSDLITVFLLLSLTVLYSTFYSNTFMYLPELKVIRQQWESLLWVCGYLAPYITTAMILLLQLFHFINLCLFKNNYYIYVFGKISDLRFRHKMSKKMCAHMSEGYNTAIYSTKNECKFFSSQIY